MAIYGKKQVHIREDNKSAVVDLLLKSQASMPEMSVKLGLSHTSLAKVVNELMQKNIVVPVDYDTSAFGRPSKVYGINGDCAISCAIVNFVDKIYVYYFDMRGFQINEKVFVNDLDGINSLIDKVIDAVYDLKEHPRLKSKILKYIYVGIPNNGLYGESFNDCKKVFLNSFSSVFKDIRVLVQHNSDYEMIAEKKYGSLKNGEKNAVLVSFEDTVSASIMIHKEVYFGDEQKHGEFTCGIKEGDGYTEEKLRSVFKELSYLLSFMDICNVVISGKVKERGEEVLAIAKSVLGKKINVKISLMGQDVPSALSGAVWLAVYSTLQELMHR